MADRQATARLTDSTEGRRYLGNTVQVPKIKSSPTGTESNVSHDDRVSSRGDSTRIAPRSSNRRNDETARDRRGKPIADPAQQQREETAKIQSHRLGFDSGWN